MTFEKNGGNFQKLEKNPEKIKDFLDSGKPTQIEFEEVLNICFLNNSFRENFLKIMEKLQKCPELKIDNFCFLLGFNLVQENKEIKKIFEQKTKQIKFGVGENNFDLKKLFILLSLEKYENGEKFYSFLIEKIEKDEKNIDKIAQKINLEYGFYFLCFIDIFEQKNEILVKKILNKKDFFKNTIKEEKFNYDYLNKRFFENIFKRPEIAKKFINNLDSKFLLIGKTTSFIVKNKNKINKDLQKYFFEKIS